MFYVAYTADGANARTRPVTFFWNGGPGSSTIWLHMGSFGPVRVEVPKNAAQPRTESAAGRQRIVAARHQRPGVRRRGRHGLEHRRRARQDVRLLRRRRGREGVLAVRPALGHAQRSLAVAEVLVRRVLRHDARRQRREPAAEPPAWRSTASCCCRPRSTTTFCRSAKVRAKTTRTSATCPTEAAVAWYHHKVAGNPPDLARFVAEVRAFAGGPYAQALMRGDSLDAATRAQIVAKLHAYLGLDEKYIDAAEPAHQPEPLRAGAATRRRPHRRPSGRALHRRTDRPQRHVPRLTTPRAR